MLAMQALCMFHICCMHVPRVFLVSELQEQCWLTCFSVAELYFPL